MKEVACYIRISTILQNEISQKEELIKYCKNQNLKPIFFIDKSSGDNLKRPEFEKLQKELFSGNFDTVIIYKLDRLSRSMADGINVISEWLEKGIRLIATSQQFDFNGTIGKMVASLLLGVAEMEQENRRERQAIGIQLAQKNKVYKGRQAGAVAVDKEKVKKYLETGMTQSDIAKLMDCSSKTIQRIKQKLN